MDQISEPAAEPGHFEHETSSAEHGDQGIALYAADRADDHFPARILHREAGSYLFHLNSSVAIGRKLVMRDGPFRFELEVVSSQLDEQGGFCVDCRVVGCRKGTVRQEWRVPVDLTGKVTLLLTRRTLTAKVKNMSPFGMGIELPIAVAKETALTIRTPDGFGYGEVRYCRRMGNGSYFVGLYLREYMQHQDSSIREFVHALRRVRISLVHSWRRFRNPEAIH